MNRRFHCTVIWLIFAIVAFVGRTVAAQPVDTNRFYSPTAEFTIVKPAAWQFASMDQVASNRATVQFKDKQIQEQVRTRANAPLVAITKHVEPYDDLNPSFQVIVRPSGPLEGKGAGEVLRILIPTIQRAMVDFEFVDEIQDTKLGGVDAAYMKARYTVKNAGGREFKTLSRMWIVPRGSSMFMISASGPPEGPDLSEQEFTNILKSINFGK